MSTSTCRRRLNADNSIVFPQTPQAQQTSTFNLPQGGIDDLTAMMSQLDQQIVGPHRQVNIRAKN